jgi:hypothetical protein
MLSMYLYRTVDDGRVCAYVSHGTTDQPEPARRFLWDDVEVEETAAALAAIVMQWVHRYASQLELPFH